MSSDADGQLQLISASSPLRRLPAAFDVRQRLFLDGIRYAIEMTELAYRRLATTALAVARSDRPAPWHFPAMMLDAWSIVDSVHRLRALVRQMPKLRKSATEHELLMRTTTDVDGLRNAVQHQVGEFTKLADNGGYAWGYISWACLNPKLDGCRSCVLVAGAVANGTIESVNPVGKPFHWEVDHVTLTAYETSVDLSSVVRNVGKYTGYLEMLVSHAIEGHPSRGSDFFLATDMVFTGGDSSSPG
jgi:hypothetical protein